MYLSIKSILWKNILKYQKYKYKYFIVRMKGSKTTQNSSPLVFYFIFSGEWNVV